MNTTANTANAYKNQQILTASPAQLTLMLYNGAIKFVHESIQAIGEKNLPKAHAANMRAQDIVREFMVTLDMQYEISQDWYRLYEFIEHCLIEGNIKKDVSQLHTAAAFLTDMREAWLVAMKQAAQLPDVVNK